MLKAECSCCVCMVQRGASPDQRSEKFVLSRWGGGGKRLCLSLKEEHSTLYTQAPKLYNVIPPYGHHCEGILNQREGEKQEGEQKQTSQKHASKERSSPVWFY